MENLPIITIGMPTYNSSRSLQLTVDAIEKLDYPKDRIRIVFVDNESKDETLRILEDFQKRFKSYYESVRLISEMSNIPKARNICVTNSIGEYILFVDSDVIILPDTIKRMLELFSSNLEVGIVGFPYRYDPAPLPHKMALSKGKVPYVKGMVTIGCTMVKRELFNKIGLFNLKLKDEDSDFTARVSKAGYIIIVDPTRMPLHIRRTKARTNGAIQQTIRHSVDAFKGSDARSYAMILRNYRPRWLVMREIFYLTLAVSIPLAIVGIILRSIPLILLFIACYGAAFAYHFPKASGKWRLINSILFPLFGMSFAMGVLKEITKYYLFRIKNQERFK
jgi:glycosyltransferase involved in cell wall biosynthesis